jgi:hypothetical protein
MVSPDGQNLDNFYLARPGADEIQLDLFGDYKSNVALYPEFQTYFRKYKPPFLGAWGKNDPFFLPPGAEAFTISPSRRTVTRSLRQSAIFCRAPSDARHLVEIVKPSEEWPNARNRSRNIWWPRPAGHRGEATMKDTARRTGERVRPRSRRREAHASIGEV